MNKEPCLKLCFCRYLVGSSFDLRRETIDGVGPPCSSNSPNSGTNATREISRKNDLWDVTVLIIFPSLIERREAMRQQGYIIDDE